MPDVDHDRPHCFRPVEMSADQKKDPKARSRPLYDIPYMFEAREFLRKKLVSKKVGEASIDYMG